MTMRTVLTPIGSAVLSMLLGACSSSGAAPADGGSDGPALLPVGQLELIIGQSGPQIANPPSSWPNSAGPWNGKAARFHPGKRLLVFETSRADITGGQLDATATDPVGKTYFVSGPGGGNLSPTGTSVLYVAAADGSAPACLGCADVIDGQGGVTIYKAALSTGAPAVPQRQMGATIHANRNKDLPFWHPSGDWIIAGIEMPRHGLTHSVGNSEVGGWVDIWAISTDGKIWVQLTDYATTWASVNATTNRPLQCSEAACATGCQNPPMSNLQPFSVYSCAPMGQAPPTVGVMRPVVSHGLVGGIPGSAKLAWSERVGWVGQGYSWSGALQTAIGDIVLMDVSGQLLPAIASYERNLTPTPEQPAGRGLWMPKDGNVIGKGYETWGFMADDSRLFIASDSFFFSEKLSRSLAAWQNIGGGSEGFVDVTAWDWHPTTPAYDNLTRYDSVAYSYAPNGSMTPTVAQFGHWEEPVVSATNPAPFLAFGSSANLNPAWDPDTAADSGKTFALEVWVMKADRSAAAVPITRLSSGSAKFLTYPTSLDGDILYITSAPQSGVASNQAGVTYRYRVGNL